MNARAVILAEFRKQRLLPFAWGSADCLSWCGYCAKALTGADPIMRLRGRYDSKIEALKVMVEEEWADLGDVAASFYPEIPTALARSGDWALLGNDDGTETLGVVVGHMICARTEARGLGQVPLTRATRAFRVG